MINFDKTVFGSVYINGKRYGDILVIGEEIKPRETQRLDEEYGGHHLVGDFEVEELLKNNPDFVIIGNGQSGVLEVGEQIKEKIESGGAEVFVLRTPEAIKKYNQLVNLGKKVNCLIHVTC